MTKLTRLSLYDNAGLYGYPSLPANMLLFTPGNGDQVCLPTTMGGSDCTVPPLVDKLRLTLRPTQLTATWEPQPATPAPSGYTVYYLGPDQKWTNTNHPDTRTTTTIPGLTPGARYLFIVRASSSTWLTASVTLPVLDTPTNLRVTADDGRLTLSWTPTAGATGYDVVYKEASAPSAAAPGTDPATGWVAVPRSGTTTSQEITGLTPGTTYDVSVLAKNAAGYSLWARGQGTTPRQAPLPAAPRLQVRAGDGRLTLFWTPPAGATGYDVAYKKASAPDTAAAGSDPATGWVTVSRSGTTTFQEIAGLTNDTPYTVRVRAKNATGPGPWATGRGTPRRPTTTGDPPPPLPRPPSTGGGGGGSRTPPDQHGNTPEDATSLNPRRLHHRQPSRRRIDARLQSRHRHRLLPD